MELLKVVVLSALLLGFLVCVEGEAGHGRSSTSAPRSSSLGSWASMLGRRVWCSSTLSADSCHSASNRVSHISSVPEPVELAAAASAGNDASPDRARARARTRPRRLSGHHLAGQGHHNPGLGRRSDTTNSGKMKPKSKKQHSGKDPSPPPAPPPGPSHTKRSPPLARPPAASPTPKPAPSKDKSKRSPPPAASPPAPKPRQPPPSGARNVFNVLSFGAKGDGEADDTEAFQVAWLGACQTYAGVLLAPQGYTFLVGPILFVGPCQPKLVFQVDGVLEAPSSPVDWKPATQKLLQWLEFAKIHDMTLQGSGLVNGLGEAWWNPLKCAKFLMSKALMPIDMIFNYCNDTPTGVRFYSCANVVVRDLSLVDSPQVTLKFDNCIAVTVDNVTISTPADSPNTDGIHLQNTQNVVIQNSVIASGDDCISVQTGCSNVVIRDIVCGPGHGISIGGLGQDGTTACVSNITVQDVSMHDTQNGLRIKTWQGGSGSVKFITFNNVTVENIANPIIIDQFYCNGNSAHPGGSKCSNRSSAVGVSDVSYKNIKGTYIKSQAVYLACSDALPCLALSMTNINLVPARVPKKSSPPPNFCWNSYGSTDSPSLCLQSSPPNQPGEARARPDQCQPLD